MPSQPHRLKLVLCCLGAVWLSGCTADTAPNAKASGQEMVIVISPTGEPVNMTAKSETAEAIRNADIALANGKLKNARDLYSDASKLDPKSPLPWYKLGVLEYKQGNFNKAIAAFDEVLKMEPGNGTAADYKAKSIAAQKAALVKKVTPQPPAAPLAGETTPSVKTPPRVGPSTPTRTPADTSNPFSGL